jgi:hypothetical protein
MNTQAKDVVLESAIETLEGVALRLLQAAKDPFDANKYEDMKDLGRDTLAVARTLRKLSDAQRG